MAERIDDLQINGLKLMQDTNGYCFTSDAVILANFAGKYCKSRSVVDLGTGNGIIAVLLAGKYGASHVTGVEIQARYAELAVRNATLNGLEKKIKIINCPMQDAHNILGYNKADAVICNPPFMRQDEGEVDSSPEIALCRREIAVTLGEVIESASRLIKFGGKFFMIHKSERLQKIFEVLAKFKLEPKRIRFVCGTIDKKPSLVMLEAVSGANPGLCVEKNLIMRNPDGSETDEIKEIYGRI